jgi:hypothetical protein
MLLFDDDLTRFATAIMSTLAPMQILSLEVLCLLESTIPTIVERAQHPQHQAKLVQCRAEQVASLAQSVFISYGLSINADMLKGEVNIPWMIERKDTKKLFDR